jgi:hypothetical protein
VDLLFAELLLLVLILLLLLLKHSRSGAVSTELLFYLCLVHPST